MDSRVQDYLDDQLQSLADLESLDTLLQNVKAQQVLLKKQLDDARGDHKNAESEAQKHSEVVKRSAEAFEEDQDEIHRRILVVGQSNTSDDAVQAFDVGMRKLQKLDIATGYIELLTKVETLRSECMTRLLEKPGDLALEPYRQLQHLVKTLGPLQNTADGAAPHLLDHINAVVDGLRLEIVKSFSTNFEQILLKINWPKTTSVIPLALQKEWATSIGRLLDLQRHDLETRERNRNLPPNSDPLILLPFEVLVSSLEQRFSYHFSGNKPTNRLDKPEFFLNHILELIAKYNDFVQDSIQPILLRHFRGSEVAFVPGYIDATTAFISALIPMLKRKLLSVAGQVTFQPSLLSHLVQEVISFDNTLSESYGYTPSSASVSWPGLSYYLLDTRGFFKQWLFAERDFALSRYNAIIENQEAGEIDFDSVASDITKPTKAAIRVNDLLETITERYRYLNSYNQKIGFLIEIQIEIFDLFFQRLRAGLDAYRNRTSTVGRTINNVSRDELAEVQGVRGLDRLCRIFGAADYLERAMRDWSDDVFFLELWAELDYRSRNAQDVSSGQTWREIQQKTSGGSSNSATTPATNNNNAGAGNGADPVLKDALFDETASKYRKIRVRSEAALAEALVSSVKQALKPYGSISTWASLSSTFSASSSSSSTGISAELDPLISLLTESLGFLRRAVGKAALRRLTRPICHAIQKFVWDGVLTAYNVSFSTAGATQLTDDLRGLCAHIDRYVGAEQGRVGMRRLLEGVTLLSLPVRGEIEKAVQPGRSGEGEREEEEEEEDEDGAWDEEEGEEGGGGGEKGEGNNGGNGSDQQQQQRMSLFQAERLIFMGNDGARQALEQLGLTSLSEGDARTILGKRIEVAS